MADRSTISARTAEATRYTYKASLIGGAQRFELTEAGLSWQIAGRRSGLWRYSDISAIALSYRPVSMQAHRFRADIHHSTGGRIAIVSTSWQTAALVTPQDSTYRAFVRELHQRMRGAASRAMLTGGLGPKTYAAALVLLALLAIAMSGLLIRAVAVGEYAGALFILGFAALFAWQVGGFVRRNRPLVYAFDRIPDALLP